jgi:hypothetical protein
VRLCGLRTQRRLAMTPGRRPTARTENDSISRSGFLQSDRSVRYSFGGEGGRDDEDREETAEAAGVVGVGAVADSIVVVGGAAVEDVVEVLRPNIFDRRSAKIPIVGISYPLSLAVATFQGA